MKIDELIRPDRSKIALVALQIASAAAIEDGGDRGRQAAIGGVNMLYSTMLKTVDQYFDNLKVKQIK